jgi:clan AA aspartic protease
MGLIHTQLTLTNPRDTGKSYEAKALVDIDALLLCIPHHIALQLGLEELHKREVITADGQQKIYPYVGPIEVHFEGRSCFTGALVLGDEVLLGAVPIENLDVVISPTKRTIIPNPESPNIQSSIVK